MEKYVTLDGEIWDVSEAKKAAFLLQHPGAKLYFEKAPTITPETQTDSLYRVGNEQWEVSADRLDAFLGEHGQDAIRVGSLLEGKKIKKLTQKNLSGGMIIDIFDDAEDEIVTSLRKDSLIQDLNIKVEGPDDDQRLDRSGRHDDVRLTNEWGKSIIINKSKSDYIKTLNAFLQKTSDAREHGKSDYYQDKAFKDWGIVTPIGGLFGTEQILTHTQKDAEDERRQKTSFEEYKSEVEDRKTTGTKSGEGFVEKAGILMDVVGGTIYDSVIGRLTGLSDAEFFSNRAMELAAPGIEKEATLKREYEKWKNRYSTDLLPLNLKIVDGITKNEYIKNKVDEEVYDTYINNFDELKAYNGRFPDFGLGNAEPTDISATALTVNTHYQSIAAATAMTIPSAAAGKAGDWITVFYDVAAGNTNAHTYTTTTDTAYALGSTIRTASGSHADRIPRADIAVAADNVITITGATNGDGGQGTYLKFVNLTGAAQGWAAEVYVTAQGTGVTAGTAAFS